MKKMWREYFNIKVQYIFLKYYTINKLFTTIITYWLDILELRRSVTLLLENTIG